MTGIVIKTLKVINDHFSKNIFILCFVFVLFFFYSCFYKKDKIKFDYVLIDTLTKYQQKQVQWDSIKIDTLKHRQFLLSKIDVVKLDSSNYKLIHLKYDSIPRYLALKRDSLIILIRNFNKSLRLHEMDSYSEKYYSEALDLHPANVGFNAPDTMEIKESRQIDLIISKFWSRERLKEKIKEFFIDSLKIGVVYVDSIVISPRMEAHLSGDCFTITPLTPIQQFIHDESYTRWEWIIKAQEAGNKTLYITLNGFINYKNEEVPLTIETYRKRIYVHVTSIAALGNLIAWINQNVSWLIGLLGIVLAAIIAHRLSLSRYRKKMEDEERIEEEKLKQKSKIIFPG